jgi:hypothetical protein
MSFKASFGKQGLVKAYLLKTAIFSLLSPSKLPARKGSAMTLVN